MRATFAPLALAALAAANPMPSATFSIKTPSAPAPSGCQTSYPGTFEIEIVNATSSRKTKRDGTPLEITLAGGILTDAAGRIGSIVANGQFQFDGPPPQANAQYTAGWSVCSNGTLALGGSSVFYECLSGMYYNLYDVSVGGQCTPIFIQVLPGTSATAAATQMSDGQITASPVTQISDGQPQATTKAPVTQISDGQIQATTSTAKPVTQISDGQIQATTGTAKPVTQISDGQIQATTGTAVKPTRTGATVTQISDGQVQGPTGMIPKPSNGTIAATGTGAKPTASASVTPYRGAAVANTVSFFGIGAGVLAFALL